MDVCELFSANVSLFSINLSEVSIIFSINPSRSGVMFSSRAADILNSLHIPMSSTELQLANPSYVLGYLCTWTGSTWKCGCRDSACTQSYWQIQSFKPPFRIAPFVFVNIQRYNSS